jgi:hypothetical protein
MARVSKSDRADAIERLRADLNPGDTVHTVLRSVSRSGMSRSIDAYKIVDGDPHWLSYSVAKAGVGTWDDGREAVKMGGAGMDMGFALVYSLSCILFPDGFGCIGEGCPSNDHSNGDRDYTPHGQELTLEAYRALAEDAIASYYAQHWHQEGGYALRQRWI